MMPRDFLDAAWRGVAEPIDSLQPRAVPQMEARDGIGALLRRRPARQVRCAKAHDRWTQCFAPGRVECKLQDASKALRQAQTRIVAAEDQVTALEFRAQAAEAQFHEAKQALLLVEDAIRKRLLNAQT
jgi:hypothetical protein